jgi:hypothetical protein
MASILRSQVGGLPWCGGDRQTDRQAANMSTIVLFDTQNRKVRPYLAAMNRFLTSACWGLIPKPCTLFGSH